MFIYIIKEKDEFKVFLYFIYLHFYIVKVQLKVFIILVLIQFFCKHMCFTLMYMYKYILFYNSFVTLILIKIVYEFLKLIFILIDLNFFISGNYFESKYLFLKTLYERKYKVFY